MTNSTDHFICSRLSSQNIYLTKRMNTTFQFCQREKTLTKTNRITKITVLFLIAIVTKLFSDWLKVENKSISLTQLEQRI